MSGGKVGLKLTRMATLMGYEDRVSLVKVQGRIVQAALDADDKTSALEIVQQLLSRYTETDECEEKCHVAIICEQVARREDISDVHLRTNLCSEAIVRCSQDRIGDLVDLHTDLNTRNVVAQASIKKTIDALASTDIPNAPTGCWVSHLRQALEPPTHELKGLCAYIFACTFRALDNDECRAVEKSMLRFGLSRFPESPSICFAMLLHCLSVDFPWGNSASKQGGCH